MQLMCTTRNSILKLNRTNFCFFLILNKNYSPECSLLTVEVSSLSSASWLKKILAISVCTARVLSGSMYLDFEISAHKECLHCITTLPDMSFSRISGATKTEFCLFVLMKVCGITESISGLDMLIIFFYASFDETRLMAFLFVSL